MKKKDIEVIVSKELLNIVGHHLEICITVKNEDNKTAPTAYGDMVEFMRGIITEKETAGQFRTAEAYRATLNCWLRFIDPEKAMPWKMVTSRSMTLFADYLKSGARLRIRSRFISASFAPFATGHGKRERRNCTTSFSITSTRVRREHANAPCR